MNTRQIPSSPGFARPDGRVFEARQAQVVYAGFWIRFFAFFIDSVLLGLLSAIGTGGVALNMSLKGSSIFSDIVLLIVVVVGALYFPLFNSSPWQGTPGKRLVGIHLICEDGQDVSLLRALIRSFAQMLSAMCFMIGYLMAGITREKTALHDLIVGTRVIHGRKGA